MASILTVAEFCEHYKVARSTFYRQVAAGALAYFKIGRATRIRKSDAEQWAKARRKRMSSRLNSRSQAADLLGKKAKLPLDLNFREVSSFVSLALRFTFYLLTHHGL